MSETSAWNEAEAYATAVGLLARREHSARELGGKLHSRGFDPAVVESVLARLVDTRLQSDERYAEVYLRQRSGKGFGPERIRAEMRERGVSDSLIAASFHRAEEEGEVDWFELAVAVYGKKFGNRPIEDMKDRAKRQRFMQYRGFNHEQIAEAIASNHSNPG